MFGKKSIDDFTTPAIEKFTPATDSNKLKIQSPWVTYFNELRMLFKHDPEVEVSLVDEDGYKIILRVDNTDKADALSQLLPTSKAFGNVIVEISVVPANKVATKADLFRKAFLGNPAVEDITSLEPAEGGRIDYVVFANKVVQYYNDDLSTVHGYKSTLFEDIAKDVFEMNDGDVVFFCTALKADSTGAPLGEWP